MITANLNSAFNMLLVTLIVSGILLLLIRLFYFICVAVDSWEIKQNEPIKDEIKLSKEATSELEQKENEIIEDRINKK